MVMEAGGRGRSEACDEARLPRAARHMTLAINSVDAGRIWKRWRGFRAAAAVVCGSEAGSIASCSCCTHVLCSRLLRLQQQPSHAALSHGARCGRCRQLHAQLLPVDERFKRRDEGQPRRRGSWSTPASWRVIVLRWPWD